MLPTQTTRTIAVAVLAVVAAAGVGACGSSSASDDDRYVNRSSQITSTPTATATARSTETETSVIRTTTPTRRTTTRSTPNTQSRTTVRGSVPAILVGTWGGGSSGETAGSSYIFTSDGRFQIRRYGASITGIAVARGSTITFYFSGRSVTSSYSVSELPEVYGYRSLNLLIDGYSYVRDA